MYISLHIKYPLLLSGFDETWGFLDRFSQNTQTPNFLKIHVGDNLLHSDRHGEADIRFSQFCERA